MRIVIAFAAALAACSAPSRDPSVTPRQAAKKVPAAVMAASAHAVAVYVNETCETLEGAEARGTGFYLDDHVVVTAGHALDVAERTFPDFAVVGPDGCRGAKYADVNREADVLFLLVDHGHDGGLTLADRNPDRGETLYGFVYQGMDVRTRSARLAPVRLASFPFEDTKLSFGTRPPPPEGDSGAPVVDAQGRLIGMTVARGSYTDGSDRPPIGANLSCLAIRYFLSQCIICEE